MDKKIMATVDKWYHFNMGSWWTPRNEKKFNRKFNTESDRDIFLMAFAYEKMNLLENDIGDLKQDIMIEVESVLDELKQEIREEVKKEMNQEIKTIISLCGMLGKDLHALKMKDYSKKRYQENTADLISLDTWS